MQQAGFFEWGNNPDGLDFDPDTILPAQDNRVSWCHFNSNSIYPLVFEREHLESLAAKISRSASASVLWRDHERPRPGEQR